MIKLHSKQHIRFVTLDKGTVFEVYAILLETEGRETVAISEPKLIRIIQKNTLALRGSKKTVSILTLATSAISNKQKISGVVSPYITSIFGYPNSQFVMGLSAQPPTIR